MSPPRESPSTAGSQAQDRRPGDRSDRRGGRGGRHSTAANELGDEVDHLYYGDEGHGANTDPGDFVKWIAEVTGHKTT